MPDFSQRSAEVELMDDLESSGEVIEITLKELETINKWLGGNFVTIDGISQLIKNKKGKITIADLGCGGGDMLKLIAKWGRKIKVDFDLIGIDANPSIIAFAKENCSNYPEITFECININDEAFRSRTFDIITSTLFTHHFTNEELKELLLSAHKQSKIGVVINDLHRHWFAYYSIKWLTSLFSKSEMVRNDAAVSVMRSFRKKELKTLLSKAGIRPYSIKWMWAFRWQLVIKSNN
ncbi:methyltransferase domain-containing protein [Fulvivirga lutimaris]|uniref:methyltransferase domain-containing protein n=1 Tax=Fulvivirga lutimaris TaxID=1819566 RepID=UPI0012BC82B4|nr:methyltransferase domain-containing protein [Fulvivirga lutimaris]MTI41945.1 methyltransferase domain-containing protein [Fulvivirga lutimaris]